MNVPASVPFPAALLVLSVATPSALAQQPAELITDRPDFTESPVVVPLHRVQIEAGGTWVRDAGASVVSGPEVLIRWSPRPRLELRLAVPDYVDAEGLSGLADAGLAVKAELGRSGPWQVGVIAGVSLPTGERGLSGETVDPEVLVAAGRDLPGGWSLGTQVAAAWLRETDVVELGATLVTGRGLTERLGAFAELAVSGARGEPAALVLHHGYTIALQPLTQLDVHAAVGLTRAAPGFLVGVGWSGRF